MAADLTDCRSCGARIWMLRTVTGVRMPVDPDRSDRGNLLVDLDRGKVRVATAADPPSPRYLPHFATCPQADRWRGGRNRRKQG